MSEKHAVEPDAQHELAMFLIWTAWDLARCGPELGTDRVQKYAAETREELKGKIESVKSSAIDNAVSILAALLATEFVLTEIAHIKPNHFPNEMPIVRKEIDHCVDQLRDAGNSLRAAIALANPSRTITQTDSEVPLNAEHYNLKFGITANRLDKARRAGKLTAVKFGKRWRYYESQVRQVWPEDFI